MIVEKAITYSIIAGMVGVVLGGISKLFKIDFSLLAYTISPVIFIISAGLMKAISNKRKTLIPS